MLTSLSIRDVVLISRLDLQFSAGLSVLTGETGAGKSILLDSLGLAIGARGSGSMVRSGADRLSVTATFQIPPTHAAFAILQEQDLDAHTDEDLVLRRTISSDGRGKAYINDQPVSMGLLRQIGDTLVEVHGQFDTHGLLNPNTHRGILDSFGVKPSLLSAVKTAYQAWQDAKAARASAEERLAKARAEEDYLRHACDELATLAPEPGEEDTLAERRRFLQNSGKLMEAVQSAQADLSNLDTPLGNAVRALDRAAEVAGDMFTSALEGLERARIELDEVSALLAPMADDMDLDPAQVETLEERLFALRAAARKHNVTVDDLPQVLDNLKARLQALDDGAGGLDALARQESACHQAYREAATTVSAARKTAAKQLDARVSDELPPLKLEKARFVTEVDTDDTAAGPAGFDAVRFVVATNPGSPPGPLAKIASGGELARFMLALKVVLTDADPVPTMIFDEVDAGIGGATAAAVGERLARLAANAQILVVTHSPQVAAQGRTHMQVRKDGKDQMTTTVAPLSQAERLEEIARMLSGAHLTDEARNAAAALLQGTA